MDKNPLKVSKGKKHTNENLKQEKCIKSIRENHQKNNIFSIHNSIDDY